MNSIRRDATAAVGVLVATAALTGLFRALGVTNAITIAVSYLLIVLIAAATARLTLAIVASVLAMLAFNFFFIPPVGTLTVADPQNAAGLVAFLGVAIVGSSVSAAIRARAALDATRQSEAVKSALLASLAHDLKTPLTAIRVASDNLQSTWLSAGDRQQQCEIVQSETDRLTRIFENVLDMARIEAGVRPAAPEWVPIGEIIAAARTHAGPDLRGYPIDISDDAGVLVRVDPRLTSGALAQLLSNAARYSPAGSRIHVRGRTAPESLELTVRDHGPGIASHDLSRVFDRFYRGESGRVGAGIGLGLAIARGLLAAEHGRVTAANCPGGGALFTMVIPCRVRTAVSESAS